MPEHHQLSSKTQYKNENRIALLYTCDDAYIPLTAVSIASVLENNADAQLVIYIATEGADGPYLAQLKDYYRSASNVDIRYLDCRRYDNLLSKKNLDRWGSPSYYVYWKLFAYDLLEEDHIWYLDSDMLCLRKMEAPAINRAVGAVIDSAHADFNKRARIDEAYYFFNTGTLYVDTDRWKTGNCTARIVDYIRKMTRKPLMCDQDILSAALQDQIEVIDPKYNFFAGYDYYGVHNAFQMYSLDKKPFYTEEVVADAKEQVMFYHCLGGVFGRPWEKGNISPIRTQFERYLARSAFPDYSAKRKRSLLFTAEKAMEFLPDRMYNRAHNLAQKIYLRQLSKKANKGTAD